jgi:hypothetical protein
MKVEFCPLRSPDRPVALFTRFPERSLRRLPASMPSSLLVATTTYDLLVADGEEFRFPQDRSTCSYGESWPSVQVLPREFEL